MADDMARALGAGEATEFTINGKKCKPRPLGLVELAEVERECLKHYKRQYLETYRDNLDMLPADVGLALMREKLEEVARWDVHDLKTKLAFDPAGVKPTDALIKWAEHNITGFTHDPNRMSAFQRVVAMSMDAGILQPEDYTILAGEVPRSAKVGYVNWWISSSFEGMLAMLVKAFESNGITRAEVLKEVTGNPTLLAEMAHQIEHLSAPAAGNG